MLFALMVKQRGAMWTATAYYENRHGQTVISNSWHRTRAAAVDALSCHFES